MAFGRWLERVDERRAVANAALRGQIASLEGDEKRLEELVRAEYRRQCEQLREYYTIQGRDFAVPDGERLADAKDLAYLEAIHALPAYEPERRA